MLISYLSYEERSPRQCSWYCHRRCDVFISKRHVAFNPDCDFQPIPSSLHMLNLLHRTRRTPCCRMLNRNCLKSPRRRKIIYGCYWTWMVGCAKLLPALSSVRHSFILGLTILTDIWTMFSSHPSVYPTLVSPGYTIKSVYCLPSCLFEIDPFHY